MWPFLCCGDRLHLRGTEVALDFGLAVAFGGVDDNSLEEALAAVLDHVAEALPACPGVNLLGDPGGGLCQLDELGVDRLGLRCLPCSVKGFAEGDFAFAEDRPRASHDFGKIVFHVVYLLFVVLGKWVVALGYPYALQSLSAPIRSTSCLAFLVSAVFSTYPHLVRLRRSRCAVGFGTYFRLP